MPSTGNIVPELYKALYTATQEGDEEKAVHYQELTDEVAKVYQGGRSLGASLAALKVLMHQKGWCQPFMKPPLTELDKSEVEKVLNEWQKVMEQVK